MRINSGANKALIHDALTRPHDPKERLDPDFPVAMACDLCGRVCHGPRRHMAEAIREHQQSVCPMRHTHPDQAQVMRILYPRR